MLSNPKLVKIGPDKYSFVLSSGSAAMFYDGYFEIQNGCLSHLFTIELGGDDGGNLKVNVKFIPSDKPYFDAVVTTTGKKSVEVGKRWILRPISKVETYRFTGMGYEVTKK